MTLTESSPIALRELLTRASLEFGLSDSDATGLEVAMIDLADAVREIYEEIIPELQRMNVDGSFDRGRFLELIVGLRVSLRHIQWHLDQAIPNLEAFMQSPRG